MSDESQNGRELIPVFVPSLAAVLVAREDEKGKPLTREEVIEVRDASPCIMMEGKDAEQMHESRGYRDIDPENCWHDWQMLRQELGRKPDIDPGPRFGTISSSDPAYQETIATARRTLHKFSGALSADGSPNPQALLKLGLSDGENTAFMWLNNAARDANGFSAELFEVPDTLPRYEVGTRLSINSGDVLDWMINDGGVIHGGYSLRYQRERMAEDEKILFDRHIGAVSYA